MASPPIVLSDYTGLSSGNIRGRLGRTPATTGERGRARMTITIQAEPLVHVFDELQLGKGPSEAIAKALRAKVEGVTEPVSERTLETRDQQRKGWAKGTPSAVARFGGGRMGPTPPTDSSRALNHSGRLAKGIVATENKTERSWTVNVAANRLDPRTSRNAAEFAFITDALNRLVPEIGDPARLFAASDVRQAIESSIGDLIIDARRRNQALREERLRAALGMFQGWLGAPGGAVSVVFG